jgi:hypothetical protein
MTQAIHVRLIGSDGVEYLQEIVVEDGQPPVRIAWAPFKDDDKTIARRFERTDEVVDRVRTYRELPATGDGSPFLNRNP